MRFNPLTLYILSKPLTTKSILITSKKKKNTYRKVFVLVVEVLNRLMVKAKDIGIIEAVKVGRDKIEVSHLQFANDTLIFCPANLETLQNVRWLLDCFALIYDLSINYSKTALIPLRCDEEWVNEASAWLKCNVMKLPITYLGIPLGANPRKVSTWKPVVEKNEKRLAIWKANTLSRARRLELIKAVLNNLPLYYLSIFKIPKVVAKKIIQV